jgi:hypothetical protein
LEDSYTVHLAADWKIVILIHLSYQPISVEEKKRNHLGVLVWYPRRLLDISFYLFQRKKKNHLGVLVWYPRRLLDFSFYLFQKTTAQNTLPLNHLLNDLLERPP